MIVKEKQNFIVLIIGIIIVIIAGTGILLFTPPSEAEEPEPYISETLTITGKIVDFKTNGAGDYKAQLIYLIFDTGDVVAVNSGISNFKLNTTCIATFTEHYDPNWSRGDADFRNVISIEYLE